MATYTLEEYLAALHVLERMVGKRSVIVDPLASGSVRGALSAFWELAQRQGHAWDEPVMRRVNAMLHDTTVEVQDEEARGRGHLVGGWYL